MMYLEYHHSIFIFTLKFTKHYIIYLQPSDFNFKKSKSFDFKMRKIDTWPFINGKG